MLRKTMKFTAGAVVNGIIAMLVAVASYIVLAIPFLLIIAIFRLCHVAEVGLAWKILHFLGTDYGFACWFGFIFLFVALDSFDKKGVRAKLTKQLNMN